MKIKSKHFEDLTTNELYEILKARAAVFVVEQNCVYQDLDDIDKKSLHIWIETKENKIAAYLRLFEKRDEKDCAQIGRVLTIERGTGLGKIVMEEAIKEAKGFSASQIYLEAQAYAIPFYEKARFEVVSEEFLEDGIPHVQMRRLIE